MTKEATIENGFAKIGDGLWLVGANQPTSYMGECKLRSLKGWIVPDRYRLHLIEVKGTVNCSEAARPFLTQIPCAAPITALSDKVLIAPAEARSNSRVLRIIPFSFRNALCVTEFTSEWLITATQGRTTRISLEDQNGVID